MNSVLLKIINLKNLFVIAFLFSTFAQASGSYNAGVMVQKRNAMTFSALGRPGTFPGGWSTGGEPTPGTSDGMFLDPASVATDATYLYVLDSLANRVSRFTLTSGAFAGWIGGIETTPTGGDAGCSTAKPGSFTPGWCTGGTSAEGFDNGMFSRPVAIAVDASGTNIYVSSASNLEGTKIQKYTASTGAYIGWIGAIGVSPTGGAAGCAGRAVGTGTPGWCTGGDGGSYDNLFDGSVGYSGGIAADATNLYVSDGFNGRLSKFDVATGSFIGWLGEINTSPTGGAAGCAGAAIGTVTPGWCTGGTSAPATTTMGSGGYETPAGLFLDSGNLYLADQISMMVERVTASTGVFTGWIGLINSPPTGGDAGCSTAAVNAFTPGWCTGGSGTISASGTKGAMWNPVAIAIQSGVLYVANFGFLKKYTLSTGAYLGWRGVASSTPTGGVSGCTSATSGNTTPGWCTGGTYSLGSSSAAYKNADGTIVSSKGLAVDASGNLFVADDTLARVVKLTSSTGAFVANLSGKTTTTVTSWSSSNVTSVGNADGLMGSVTSIVNDGTYLYAADKGTSRISRYTMSTGAFAGWIGIVATAPTGGSVAGCTGAAVSSFTPGWCTGGTSKSGTGDGALAGPQGLAIDSGGSLYVVDSTNSRILKFTASTGAFIGWIGKIATAPTGGATGCNGKAAGNLTPGWCTGGTSNTLGGTGDGMIYSVNGGYAYVDTADNLYVSDFNNGRVLKFTASTGVFVGWIGMIATSPTGGATGCNGKAAGTATPGWCTGGTSVTSSASGGFSWLGGMAMSGTNLYVGDGTRIQRFTASTGALTGWYGLIGTTPTGGDAGCATAAVGSESPGWCTGGTAAVNNFLNNVRGIAIDAQGYFYIMSESLNAIHRKNFARSDSGFFGLVATSPTGGAANCNGLAVGKITPGWCTGGSYGGSVKPGTFNGQLIGVTIDATNGYLFVSDGVKINRISIKP